MDYLSADIQYVRKDFTLSAKFSLEKAKVTVILGASGCGKSSLLRLLAGLETPERGNVSCNGETWFDKDESVNFSPQQRSVGFVFQDYALFENMTVLENICFGVKQSEGKGYARELVIKLNLDNVKDKYPAELSGGQKQRVALGRALAIRPKLLLLDEPLSAIDHSLRKQLQRELKAYIKAIECPVILVTHDLDEARLMADKLIVMENGKISRQGNAQVVFNHPINKDTAKTLGWQNILPVTLSARGYVNTVWGKFIIDTVYVPNAKWISIKPEKIRFSKPMENSLQAIIEEAYDMGLYQEFYCRVDESLVIVVRRPSNEPAPSIHSKVSLHLSSQHLILLNSNYKVPACFDTKLIESPRFLNQFLG